MNRIIKKFREYLKENPFDGGQREVGSVIDFLVECYMEANPVSGQKIKAIEKEMGPFFEALPFVNSEKLFLLIYDLCGEYENAAFREGLKLGLHLREEISGE